VCGLDLPNWSKFVEANLERSFSGERVYKDDKLKCNLSLLSRDLCLLLDMRERASQYFGKAITESVMFAELKKQVLMAAKLEYNPSLRNPRNKEQRGFFIDVRLVVRMDLSS